MKMINTGLQVMDGEGKGEGWLRKGEGKVMMMR